MTIVAQVIKNKQYNQFYNLTKCDCTWKQLKLWQTKVSGHWWFAEDEKVVGIFSERDYTP